MKLHEIDIEPNTRIQQQTCGTARLWLIKVRLVVFFEPQSWQYVL